MGTALNFSVLEKTVSKMRKCESAPMMSAMMDQEDCLAEIREDCKSRS